MFKTRNKFVGIIPIPIPIKTRQFSQPNRQDVYPNLTLLFMNFQLHLRSLTASLPLKNGGTGRRSFPIEAR